MGLLKETNQHKFLQEFACRNKQFILFGQLLCTPYLNGSKEFLQYKKIIIFEFIAQKVLQNFEYKRGNQISSLGGGKKGGNQIFSKILGEKPKPCTQWD